MELQHVINTTWHLSHFYFLPLLHIQTALFMRTLIKNATLVNEGKKQKASIVIENDIIAEILSGDMPQAPCEETIDAQGMFLLPGIIDDHVHFRQPGLTHKATIQTESRAAAAGGVTSYFDMPNTVPQTTTLEALESKMEEAAKSSLVNYSFFFGATNENSDLLPLLDRKKVCGVKLFMGSSTGNMLVDREESLRKIFSTSPLPIMAHCEDTSIINENTLRLKALYGDDPNVEHHPEIRTAEACYASSALAVKLAKETGARLHIAHLTTAEELKLFSPYDKKITAEACIAHLYFTNQDYALLGTKIKCNPAIKTAADRSALRLALNDGRITTIGTDHAPHLIEEKRGGCLKAASGMPMIQFSLVAMLELVDEGVLSMERMVELMCHNPALLFSINKRGFIRKGFKADLVLVKQSEGKTVTKETIESKCKWSPLDGYTFRWQVDTTFCNGKKVYSKGAIIDRPCAEAITFDYE